MTNITDAQIEAWLRRQCRESSIAGHLDNLDRENAYKLGYLQIAFQSIINQPKRRRDYIKEIRKEAA